MASDLEKRVKVALESIREAYGTEAGEFGTTLFVEHHLAELPPDYLRKYTGSEAPEPAAILALLELKDHWGDEGDDDLENLDFSLPGDVTDYVLSARFDESGNIEEITMES
jgi:hypothetical protein